MISARTAGANYRVKHRLGMGPRHQDSWEARNSARDAAFSPVDDNEEAVKRIVAGGIFGTEFGFFTIGSRTDLQSGERKPKVVYTRLSGFEVTHALLFPSVFEQLYP